MKYTEAVGDLFCPGEKKKGITPNSEVTQEAGPKQLVASEAGHLAFRAPPKDARESNSLRML
jgi:hypothetical protein